MQQFATLQKKSGSQKSIDKNIIFHEQIQQKPNENSNTNRKPGDIIWGSRYSSKILIIN